MFSCPALCKTCTFTRVVIAPTNWVAALNWNWIKLVMATEAGNCWINSFSESIRHDFPFYTKLTFSLLTLDKYTCLIFYIKSWFMFLLQITWDCHNIFLKGYWDFFWWLPSAPTWIFSVVTESIEVTSKAPSFWTTERFTHSLSTEPLECHCRRDANPGKKSPKLCACGKLCHLPLAA